MGVSLLSFLRLAFPFVLVFFFVNGNPVIAGERALQNFPEVLTLSIVLSAERGFSYPPHSQTLGTVVAWPGALPLELVSGKYTRK